MSLRLWRVQKNRVNLETANQVIEEIQRQINPLRKQAETAQKYFELKEELKKNEVNKIKEVVATLTEKKVVSKKTVRDALQKYRKTYKTAYIKPLARAGAEYVLNFVNEEAIMNKIRTVIEVESPIEESCQWYDHG